MAKGFIAEFLVKVTSSGQAKTKKEIESVAQTVDRVSEAHANAGKNAKNLYNTMEKGVIGVANGTKSFSKMAETIGGGGTMSLVGVYATLAANVFAVSAAFNALRSAAQVQQVLQGLEASGNRMGLTLSIATKRVQDLSGGMISMEQAARSTAQFMSGGFSTKELERFTVLAKNVSIALGRNMTDSMDRLTKGVIKLEPELLDELGIMTKLNTATAAYAVANHKNVNSLTQFERSQAFMNAVAKEGELKFHDLADAAGDTTAYDRLSATFANLTKDFFGFINGAMGPLVKTIADSKVALVGFALLFASTIRKQLLPMFNDLGKRGAVVSAQLAKDATASLGAISESLLAKDGNIRDFVESVENGSATFKDFEREHKVNSIEIIKDTKKLTDSQEALRQKFIDLENTRGKVRQNIATKDIPNLQKTIREQQDTVDALQGAQEQLNKFGFGQTRAAAHATAGNAINLAGSGNWKLAAAEFKTANKAFAESAQYAVKPTGLLNKSLEKLAPTMFNVTTRLRMLGAGFLYALPYIGIAIAVISTLISWLDKATPAQEKLNQATKDLGENTANTGKLVVEYNKALAANAPLALKTAQALTIKGNALSELTSRYHDMIDAMQVVKKESELNEQNTTANSGWEGYWSERHDETVAFGKGLGQILTGSFKQGWDTWTTGGEIAGNKLLTKLGLSATTEVGKTVKSLMLSGDEQQRQMGQTLASASQWDPRKTNSAILKYREELKRAGTDTKAVGVVIGKILDEVGDGWVGAGEAVKAYQDATQAAASSLSTFFKNAAISTPYDDVVSKLNTVSESMNDLQKLGIKTSSPDMWKDLLSGLSPDIVQSFNDRNVASQVTELQTQEAIANTLQDRVDKELKLTDGQKEQFEYAKNYLETHKHVLTAAQGEVLALDEQFKKAQQIARVSASQLQLIEARKTASAAVDATTVAGLAHQLDLQQQANNLQIEALKQQKQIIDAKIVALSADLKRNEYANTNNLLELRSLNMQKLATKEMQRQNLELAKQNLQGLHGEAVQKAQERIQGLNNVDAVDARARSIDAEIKSLTKETDLMTSSITTNSAINDLKASQLGLQNQITAKSLENLTAEEKSAQLYQKRVELAMQEIDTISQINAIWADVEVTQRKIAQITSGRRASIVDELADIQDNYKIQRASLLLEASKAKQTLDTDNRLQKARIESGRATDETASEITKQYNEQNQILQAQTNAKLTQLDVSTKLAILEKINFDVQKEGLEWQQQAYELQQKSLDSTKDLGTQLLANKQYAQETARIRANRPITEDYTAAQELQTKIQAYEYAKKEINVRMTMIDLEYALLDAQRTALAEELNARKQEYLTLSNLTEDSPRIVQLTKVIDKLNGLDITKAANSAKDAALAQLEGMRLEIDRLSVTSNDYVSNFMKPFMAVQDLYKLYRTRQTASDVANQPLTAQSMAVITKDNAVPLKDAMVDVGQKVAETQPLLNELQNRIITIDENVAKIASGSTEASGPVGAGPSGAMQFFMQRLGLNKAQAAGLAGNLQAESGFDPRAVGDNGAAFGVAQWHPDRQADFKRSMGVDVLHATLDQQLEFVARELEGSYKRVLAELKRTNDPREAARIIDARYEISNGAALGKRQNFAAQFAASFKDSGVAQATADTAKNTADLVAEAHKSPYYANYDPNAPDKPNSDIVVTGVRKPSADLGPDTPLPGPSGIDIAALDETINAALPATLTLQQNIDLIRAGIGGFIDSLNELGPQGAVVASLSTGALNISSALDQAFHDFKTGDLIDKVQATAAVVMSVLQTIDSVTKASADAKMANIDAQIAAEQRLDGKSAASVAKIEALERKKDSIARKEFNTHKKLMMAEAIVSTAAGVANALRLGPLGIPLAVIIGALGAAQLAIIAGTSYQSTTAPNMTSATAQPTTLSIGARGDIVDLAHNNPNPGGELGYLRGTQGRGTNSSNYSLIGSAYGGRLPRGYGNTAFAIGEKGPEILETGAPLTVRQMNDNSAQPRALPPVTFNIHALDAKGIDDILRDRRGNIIDMLREAANANGQPFLEAVNTNVYTSPRTSRL